MKTSRQITSASLTLLMAGSSLLYTTPSSIVKAEPNQNVSNSLQTNTQRDRTSVKKAMRDTLQLGYPGILAKISKDRKTWSYAAGVADLRTISCVLPKQVQLSNKQIRLCIVDDHSFIRESLHTILSGLEDLQVVGMAEDGEQALELCGRLKPDVVLMDLEMPNLDGIHATKMIKKRWPDIRVLILSTFQNTERAKEIIRNGADGYLLKSIDSRELAESIRLVYRGGTMITHDLFHRMWEENEETGLFESRSDGIEYGLTKRELKILELLSQGSRYKTIASTLYLSNGTVRNYASNLYEKLGVKNREEAVQKAKDIGLLS